MRHCARSGPWWLMLLCIACGRAEPNATQPSPPAAGDDDARAAEALGDSEEAISGEAQRSESLVPVGAPRIEITADFHRTRVGPARGFWVLATLTNAESVAVVDARAKLRLLDTEGTMLMEVLGEPERLDAGASAAVVVLVEAPVEHEQLELSASAVALEVAIVEAPVTVELDHDPPQRAERGGYFVLGQTKNTGSEALEGARIEVRAFDRDDRLLGVDWFDLASLAAGETAPFDLGGLRYEEVPKRFELEVNYSRGDSGA